MSKTKKQRNEEQAPETVEIAIGMTREQVKELIEEEYRQRIKDKQAAEGASKPKKKKINDNSN